MDTLVYLCFDFYRELALKTRANGLASEEVGQG